MNGSLCVTKKKEGSAARQTQRQVPITWFHSEMKLCGANLPIASYRYVFVTCPPADVNIAISSVIIA